VFYITINNNVILVCLLEKNPYL